MPRKDNKPKVRRFKSERIAKMDARAISRISDERLRRLNTREAIEMATRAKTLVDKRLQGIYRAGLFEYSFAKKYMGGELMAEQKMTRSAALRTIAKARKFFEAQTSSAARIRKVISAEEGRLSQLAGRDIKFSSPEMRSRFWSAYMEFMNDNPEYNNKFDSDRVQQMLAESGFWQTRGFTSEDLETVLTKLEG